MPSPRNPSAPAPNVVEHPRQHAYSAPAAWCNRGRENPTASSIDRSSIPKLRVLYLRYEDVLLCPNGWDMVGALGAMVGGIRDLPHFEVLHLLVDGESRGRMREDVEELTLRRILAGLAESSLQEVHYTSSIDWCGPEREADVKATCDILRACLSGIAFHKGAQIDHFFTEDPEPNHKSDMWSEMARFSC